MKKQTVISIVLISLGSALEIFYYAARYMGDGIHWSISIIQGIALTALLMGLFIQRRSPAAWFFIVPLVMYSIFNTAAGQRQSLTMNAERQIQNINNQRISTLQSSLKRKQAEYNKTTDLINESIEDFDDAWEWKNTTAKYEGIQDDLDNEMKSIEDKISSLRNPEIAESESGKLYKFYSDLFGWSSMWLQFFLQVAFSAFVAIMAPVGILLYPSKKEDETDWYPLVKKWVNTNWIGLRNNSSRIILEKDKFLDYHAVRGFTFRADHHDKIKDAAIKIKAVDKNLITIDNEHEAIEVIMSKLGR